MSGIEFLGIVVSFCITLAIFSFLLGNNSIFRLATSILIGVAAGFSVIMAFTWVIIPHLQSRFEAGGAEGWITGLIPVIFGILLLMKITPLNRKFPRLGNPALAFLVGVGAAAAIGGAIEGTLIPQTWSLIQTISPEGIRNTANEGFGKWMSNNLSGILMLTGTLSTLIFFQFSGRKGDGSTIRQNNLVEKIGMIGKFFIVISLGWIFAAVYQTAIAALIDRVSFLISFVKMIGYW